ncbi:ABC-type dipeptide/oligopeptide/nickel transport system, permease component [Tistlia consotensis]|uniref:ABC-type dipeptide/oligopeptide/nickel transport system, permease component n=1 Tax=Tistlia consotensis USBA 355 TaxID=560819 RepID=A0A1Y6BE36_9PROT|nr:ABC transporter permease subunit [Tistlia consotensis]SMF04806.1 ABC-type dipeptide/oligopeptide/nickel transport system, permease component [Tistlia consotensis USBA 355]SNR54815.1 ABC-type dipeptide/oligopeptide/nickel transport system, permease component [Tistlia consotensis]
MAVTAEAMPKPTPFYLRLFRAVLLLRESWIGMIGASLVAFWVLMALICNLLLSAGLLFHPNTGFAGYTAAPPGTTLIMAGDEPVRISDYTEKPAKDIGTLISKDEAARMAGFESYDKLQATADDLKGQVEAIRQQRRDLKKQIQALDEGDPKAEELSRQRSALGDRSDALKERLDSLAVAVKSAGKYDVGTFWLGTDKSSRDILSRLIFGARQVLIYAPLAILCAYAVGIPMGLWAGYRGGWIDSILSYISNVILSFPPVVLYVVIIIVIGPSGLNIVLAVTFASAPGIMRIVRSLALDLRTREYIMAAETRGESVFRILFVELLPNARGPIIVDAMLRLGYTVITIGVLGFLGLGLPPPNPDWGKMISEARQLSLTAPHAIIFPCIALSSLVLGFNLLADALREISLKD